jgi:hypothetical protein
VKAPPSDAALSPASTAAEAKPDPVQECTWGSDRILGGNTLLTPAFVDSALVLTSLNVRAGLQFTRVPDLPFGRLGTILLRQLETAGQVDFSLRLHERVGISGSLVVFGNLGTSPESLAISGGQYFIQGTGGLIVNVLRLPATNTQVSILGNIGGGGGKFFNIVPLLDQLSTAPAMTAEDVLSGNLRELLVTPTFSFVWSGSIAAAQPLSRDLSVQLSLGLNGEAKHLEPFDVGTGSRGFLTVRTLTPRLGVALAGDARAYEIPVALMLEYQLSWLNVTNSNTDTTKSHAEHILAADLYYSGRSDVQIGVVGFIHLDSDPIQGRALNGASAPSGAPTLWGGQLVLRCFW